MTARGILQMDMDVRFAADAGVPHATERLAWRNSVSRSYRDRSWLHVGNEQKLRRSDFERNMIAEIVAFAFLADRNIRLRIMGGNHDAGSRREHRSSVDKVIREPLPIAARASAILGDDQIVAPSLIRRIHVRIDIFSLAAPSNRNRSVDREHESHGAWMFVVRGRIDPVEGRCDGQYRQSREGGDPPVAPSLSSANRRNQREQQCERGERSQQRRSDVPENDARNPNSPAQRECQRYMKGHQKARRAETKFPQQQSSVQPHLLSQLMMLESVDALSAIKRRNGELRTRPNV